MYPWRLGSDTDRIPQIEAAILVLMMVVISLYHRDVRYRFTGSNEWTWYWSKR